MVSFSLRQRIFLPPPTGPSPVSFHLSQFGGSALAANAIVFSVELVYFAMSPFVALPNFKITNL
jgi:hypothetical protein